MAKLPPYNGIWLREQAAVYKVMKGIRNLKPLKKRLAPMWSVKAVLSFFKRDWGDIKRLLLEELTIKMTMLIGLVMAKRLSTIALITVLLEHHRQLEDSVEFSLIGLEKHSREGYTQESVMIFRPQTGPGRSIKRVCEENRED